MYHLLKSGRSTALVMALLALVILGLFLMSTQVDAAGWKTYPSSGGANVTPVVADFDGDGLHDLGYFDPSNGNWSYKASNVGSWFPPVDRTLAWSEPARIKDAERGYGKDNNSFVTFHEASYTEQLVPGDYDGDLKDDPAYVYDDGVNTVFKYKKSSASYATQTYNFPSRITSFTVLAADIDGDGRLDPLIYAGTTGWIYGLKSSNSFSNSSGLYFSLNTGGVYNAKPIVADYDNAKADPNDKSDSNYPKGRDFLDDIVLFGQSGNFIVFRSHYGAYDLLSVTVSYGQSGDLPVAGDFDGDGIKDLALYRPGTWPPGGVYKVLQSSKGFSTATADVLSYSIGASDTQYNDVPVAGRFDTDFTTDFATYRKGTSGPGEWHIYFSADYTDYPTNGVLNSGGAYPDPRFGGALASWDDQKKQCYETEFGWPSNGPTPSPSPTGTIVTPTPFPNTTPVTPPANSDVDSDGYPGGAKIPCGWEAIPPSQTPQPFGANILDNYRFDSYRVYAGGTWYPSGSVNEMAQTFTDGVKYKFNPRAFNVSYGNYLDPRANSLLPFFKYVSGKDMWIDGRNENNYLRPDLPTEHPGAIMVSFDGDEPVGVPESGNIRTGRRYLYADNGSYIYKRADFKQWLIDNRQGPLKDPRRWYNLIALAEVENSVKLYPDEYVAILKDYANFLDEVRDAIKTDYGLSVYPSLTLSGLQGPGTDSSIESGVQTAGEPYNGTQLISRSTPPVTPPAANPSPTPVQLISCDTSGAPTYLDGFSGSLTTWPTPGADGTVDSAQLPNWRRYYREVLSQINTTSGSWSESQRANWREFFTFASIDPFYSPVDADLDPAKVQYLDVDADPGGSSYHAITYAQVKTQAEAHADRMRCAAKVFWDDAVDLTGDTPGQGRGRPTLVQQFGAIIYGDKMFREGWALWEMPAALKNALMSNYGRPSVGALTPTPAKPYCFAGTGVSSDAACQGAGGEANQRYGVRTIRQYSAALTTHLIMKDLMEEGWGKLGAVAYWITIDEPRYFDYMTWKTWGDLNGSNMEPLIDQGNEGNIFFTPTGRIWLAVAAGKSDYLPPDPYWFMSNGVNGNGANPLQSVFTRPAWYAAPTPKP